MRPPIPQFSLSRSRVFIAGRGDRRLLLTSSLLLLSLIASAGTTNAQSFSAATGYAVGANPNFATAGDFNGDGKPDLATANVLSKNVSVLLNNGDGTFQDAVGYETDSHPTAITTGDFNKDGKLDLATANVLGGATSAGSISILLGKGDGTFQPAINYDVSSPGGLKVADFNGDGKPDLVTTAHDSNSVSVLLGNGAGTFLPAETYEVGTAPGDVAVADFNGDGKLDLAVTNRSSNNISILLGNGHGAFQTAVNYPTPSGPIDIVASDVDGDQKQDLIVAAVDSNALLVLLGNGNGGFQTPVSYSVGAEPRKPELGDLNGDGKTDIVVVNAGGNSKSVLRGNGDGTFQPAVTDSVGPNSFSPVVSDFNADGKPDLAIVNAGSGLVDVRLNSPSPRSVAMNATTAVPANGVLVATFIDYDTSLSSSNFTTTINWGDGTATTPGTVSVNTTGGFNINGTHTYSSQGIYTVNVKIADGLGNFATVTGTATVSDAPLAASGKPITATGTIAFTSVVSTFTARDPASQPSQFWATIDWGDGTTASPGTVSTNGSGGFNITGTHAYAKEGIYTVNVQLADLSGNAAAAASTATVADAPLTATGKTISSMRGVAFTAVVANFADADPDGQSSDFSATITWGDSTTPTTGIVSAKSDGGFDVTGTHTYAKTGSFSISVLITDVGGSTGTANSTAESLIVTTYPTLSLSDSEIESIRANPNNCLAIFEQRKAELAQGLGFPASDAELYAAFCSIVAYRMAPYGESSEAEFPNMLWEPFLNCGNYTLLTGYLNELRSDHVPLRFLGWDFGAVGNHSQIFANQRLLLDPTIALIALGSYEEVVSGVQVGPISLFTTRLDEISDFRGIVIDALSLGQYKPSDVIYDYGTVTEFNLNVIFDSTKANQTITFDPLENKTFGDPDFTVNATASSGLTVVFSSSGQCAITGSTVSLTGAGSCRIHPQQWGDQNFNPAPRVTRIFNIAKAVQTITFDTLTPKTYGDPNFSVSATSTSALPVSFAAAGNCTVTGDTVHITGGGSCTISATQEGNSNFKPALDVVQTFSIAGSDQTITFEAPANKTFGDPDFIVNATASSNLLVSFTASGQCTVSGNRVHLTTSGSCTITASQEGDGNYNSASNVAQTFSIARANQTITFEAPANKTFGDPDFIVNATASSNLSVSLTASGPCTVSGNTVHLTAPGSCTITAAQGGDSDYNPASNTPQTFIIAKSNQTIAFSALTAKTFGDPDFSIEATATSGLPVSLGATGGCAVTGNNVHITGGGSCTITASQGGDSNFNAAPNIAQSFSIAKVNQTITFGALTAKTFGDPDFSIAATATSGLPVSLGATGSCTVTGNNVHITGGGSCTITASQGGDSNFNAAPNIVQSFSIAKSNQTIAFSALKPKTFGDPDFSITVTVTSGLPVSLGATGSCTVTGTNVHITGGGSCTITASQAGDSNFNATSDVPQSFDIAKAATTTAVSSSSNPSSLAQSVTLTATVTSTAATPTGTVQFKDNATNIGDPAPVNAAGVAQVTISSLTLGTHIIAAEYSGDENRLASNGTLTGNQVVKDQPSLSINDASLTEGDSGTKTLNLTVTLSEAISLTASVDFATANGTATAGSDYQSANGTLTFAPGQTTQTIGVAINGDQIFEPDETFFVNLSNPVNAVTVKARGVGTILNDDASGGIVSFSQSNYTVSESAGVIVITVNRTGDTSAPVTLDYATPDAAGANASVPCSTVNGFAMPRCDFTAANGTLRFAAGETAKTFSVLITQDNYVEGPETLSLTLSNVTGGAVFGVPSTSILTITDDAIEPATNPIDDSANFVRQHYHDFLNREPDTSGLNFWTNEISSCGPDQLCIAGKRANASAAFYLSIEFQQTGYLVERIYKAAYGDATGTSTLGGEHQFSVPVVRFNEFLSDTQRTGQGVVVGDGNWQQQLEDNKAAFTAEFVQRSRFTDPAAFPLTMTPAQFVDKLNANAGNPLSQPERDQLVTGLSSGGMTRAQVLRAVAEDPDLAGSEFNRAFVLMQYFGYLRRNPNDAPEPGLNYTGYEFWLTKLNQFNGNFQNAEMVQAFITSIEYRQRFGP